MELVLNHITRMAHPRICVAGIDMETGRHVRPTTPPSDPITRALLRENGGPFRIGSVVDFGPMSFAGNPPEVEDYRFVTARARLVGDIDDDEYLEVLDRASADALSEAFGSALKAMPNGKYAVDVGEGTASLAVLEPRGIPRLVVNDFGSLRLRLSYPDAPADLSVTDIRCYAEDQRTIRHDVVADVNRRLANGVDCYLMLGLSRPFEGSADHPVHWLQANGLCVVDRATGETP